MDYLKIKFSLTPIKMLIILLALGPWYGVYQSYTYQEVFIGLVADLGLFISFSVYTLVVIVVIGLVRSNVEINYRLLNRKQLTRHLNRLLVIAILSFLVVLLVAGQYIISGEMDRGEVRTHAGFLGPIYSLVLKYILPLLSFISLIYIFQIKGEYNFNKLKLYFVIICIILSALLTGAKATLIFILLPIICYLWAQSSKVSKAMLLCVLLVFMAFSHVLFGGEDILLLDALNYLFARSTFIAAYGVLGSWEFANTADYELVPLILNSLFGNHISSMMIDTSAQLFGDTGKLVTYAYYPNYERAAAGSVNLTLTLFGDLYIYFHTYWFIGLFVFMSLVWFVFNKMISSLKNGHINRGVLLFVYINMVILPIINSGGPLQLISLPTAIYILIVYYLLRLLLPKNYIAENVQNNNIT